jgi:hypothetical protein
MNTIAEGKSAQVPDQAVGDKRSPNPALVDLTKESYRNRHR